MAAYDEAAVLQTRVCSTGTCGVTWGQAQKYKEDGEEGAQNPKRKTYVSFFIDPDLNLGIGHLPTVPLCRQLKRSFETFKNRGI